MLCFGLRIMLVATKTKQERTNRTHDEYLSKHRKASLQKQTNKKTIEKKL